MIRLSLLLLLLALGVSTAEAAVDTRDKRSSAISPGSPWRDQLPAPDGNVTEGDRAQVGGLYSGLATATLPVVRASMILPGSPWRGIVPGPDGAVGPGDRQAVAFLYAGILAGAPPAGGTMPVFRYYYDQMER